MTRVPINRIVGVENALVGGQGSSSDFETEDVLILGRGKANVLVGRGVIMEFRHTKRHSQKNWSWGLTRLLYSCPPLSDKWRVYMVKVCCGIEGMVVMAAC